MRPPTALAVALATLVACSSTAAGTSGQTSLRVVYKRTATAAPVVRLVTCSRVPGTDTEPTRACARLDELALPFAPVSRGSACTEIYGGPQTVRVTGTFKGRRIWVAFRRTNGCEIDRWNRHAFLFPGGP
jgi:Subtilisin inhibitor-like